MSRIDWAPLDAHLRALAASGLSASEIGRILGVSRNGVIGRCATQNIRFGKQVSPKAPRWPAVDSAAYGEGLSGQCFGGDRDHDPGDGGLCRARRPATEMQTASVLGGET